MPCRFATLLLLLPTLLAGCGSDDSLQRILERGELRVVSRNSPTTLYLYKSQPDGFEHALAERFAQDLGVQLSMEPVFKLNELFLRLRRHEADIAAAGLSLTGEREARFPHSEGYLKQAPQVVYVAGSHRPRDLRDSAGMRLVVLKDSSHASSLRALRDSGLGDLQWREVEAVDSLALLELVDSGEADLAVIDSHEFEIQQSLYPRLRVAFNLAGEQEMVWYLQPGRDNARLQERINAFFARLKSDGTLARLREIYFGHSRGVSRAGSHTFNRMMESALPRYRDMIRQVAAEYQMDWHLLAAIAYQESHWDPLATSPTGVRGMMMLTLPTAEELGVTDRLDPLQSLRGGARYFRNMKLRLPPSVGEPDRTWMALAAYNIGLGHLRDARRITRREGGNPDRWSDLRRFLPLLQKSPWYENTRYGYARGSEAVTYVRNIRHYMNILAWQELPEQQPVPPVAVADYVPPAIRGVEFKAL